MSDFPKDGSTFIVEAIDRQAYRWAKYKPDGARQMKKPGRWQKQVWSGDYFKWENCEEPVGVIAPTMEDGPISGAVKALAAKDAELERLRRECSDGLDALTVIDEFWEASPYPENRKHLSPAEQISSLDNELNAAHDEIARLRGLIEEAQRSLDDKPEYHSQGMGCGLEDRGITDRYDAMEHGWEKAMERVYGENIAWAKDALASALKEKADA